MDWPGKGGNYRSPSGLLVGIHHGPRHYASHFRFRLMNEIIDFIRRDV